MDIPFFADKKRMYASCRESTIRTEGSVEQFFKNISNFFLEELY